MKIKEKTPPTHTPTLFLQHTQYTHIVSATSCRGSDLSFTKKIIEEKGDRPRVFSTFLSKVNIRLSLLSNSQCGLQKMDMEEKRIWGSTVNTMLSHLLLSMSALTQSFLLLWTEIESLFQDKCDGGDQALEKMYKCYLGLEGGPLASFFSISTNTSVF